MIGLKKIKRIHFTGIKGVGMTALACVAKDFGMKVTGSDVAERFVTDETLRKKGISVRVGFTKENMVSLKPDLVVYGAAHQGEGNPEVAAAATLDIPTLTLGETLGLFYNTKKGISVAGVGGKSTTTAMLATILEQADKHPSYMVGAGKISALAYPGKYDHRGNWFVAEADEYVCSPRNQHPKFYYQQPTMIVLPSLAYDHPDIYQSPEETLKVFKIFVEKLPQDGVLIVNLDSEMINKLLKVARVKAKLITYGETQGEWRLQDYQAQKETIHFKLTHGQSSRPFAISVPGKINGLNATGAILASEFMGLPDEEIQAGLLEFTGVERRFEKIAQVGTTLLYDDYAHHPQEIQATLSIAKERLTNKKILVIFQPHTYSRTKALLSEFAQSFKDADEVLVTNIFASARESDSLGITGQILAERVRLYHPQVTFCADESAVLAYLAAKDLADTAIFTLGAGDIFLWHERIMALIKEKA